MRLPTTDFRRGHAADMKILFVDATNAYDARTSSVGPMGGTQSAIAHLAVALARAGVGVIVANRLTADVTDQGVDWVSLVRIQQGFAAYLHAQGVTHLVAAGTAALATLRAKVAWGGAWVLWNHHWIDQPATALLADAAVRDNWDAFVSISEFQHAGMARAFALPPERHWILRNAISPHFANLFSGWDEFRAARQPRTTTRWVYSSTPFRGLDVLAVAWRRLNANPRWSCTAVSGMQLYGGSDAPFETLFATIAATPGMTRLEPMGQAALARVLAEHDFWSYPCTFPETSCISALEAVAAGLYPVTTALGALPETLEGWGTFVAPDGDRLVERWCEAALAQARIRDVDRGAWLQAAWTQRERVVRDWNWRRRAREWIACLDRVRGRAPIH
jgi:glycosyltransferase involved in cell wall biosynthesis